MSRHKGHGSKIAAPKQVLKFMEEFEPPSYAIEKHEDVVKMQKLFDEQYTTLKSTRPVRLNYTLKPINLIPF
jgi:hypothetical protein